MSHESEKLPTTTGFIPLDELIQRQDSYFQSGATHPYRFRLDQLKKLMQVLRSNENAFLEALKQDLRKDAIESYMAEVGIVYAEINDAIKHLRQWMKPRKVATPLTLWPARSRIVSEPLGRALIISPWNYPFQLTFAPLVGAIAAGNVVVLKPSEIAPATAAIMEKIINETFAPEYIRMLTGGVELSTQLLERRWNHIFFTGSTMVGKVIAAAAAKHLTPCILELGGKSPCIVTRKANLTVAARRIVFGKFLNAGQTCVAPDYLLVEDSIHDQFIEVLKKEIQERFGSNPIDNAQLPKIISEKHFARLVDLIEPSKVVFGGRTDAANRLIEPTLLTGVKMQDPIMQEEIFGPLLPIVPVKDLTQAKKIIRSFEHPLALYLFSEDKREHTDIVRNIRFGGGCINDTLMHLANPHLPFGGVGASGMGGYHGKFSFDAFSHQKALVVNGTSLDVPLRYAPWTEVKARFLRLLLK